LTWELILLQSPATAPEKGLIARLLGTPRLMFDEYISKLFPQLETKVYVDQEKSR
jgi:hypothetical protein